MRKRIKKQALTLLEVMIVIFLIGIIGSVIGYNMKGSLEKGKAFKTQEGIKKVYEVLQLEMARGAFKLEDIENRAELEKALKASGLVRKPKDLLKDGWGEEYQFQEKNGDIRIISERFQKRVNDQELVDVYPWDDDDEG